MSDEKQFTYKNHLFKYRKKNELLRDIFKTLNINDETNIYSNYLVWSNKLKNELCFDEKVALYIDYRLVREQIRNNTK